VYVCIRKWETETETYIYKHHDSLKRKRKRETQKKDQEILASATAAENIEYYVRLKEMGGLGIPKKKSPTQKPSMRDAR